MYQLDPVPMSDQPIICFGAETDAALEHLKLPDTILPRLHDLAHSVQSSKWVQTLCKPEWGFSFEHAMVLSRAMILDSRIVNLKVHGIPSCWMRANRFIRLE